MENVNKGGRRVNKHDETMGEKFFRFFHGFDTLKFIVDLSEDESFLKNLLDMLFFFFVLQVAKKDGCFYPPTKYVVFPFL
jgi:hypothetical protein